MATRVLVVDNYDSFVFNIVQYLAQLGAWVTIVQGFIFVVCVLTFRRGIVGELARHVRIPVRLRFKVSVATVWWRITCCTQGREAIRWMNYPKNTSTTKWFPSPI